ncbi:MAG: hypothetical protein II671_08660 [Salinivirgaceae bacterium]|nr:hypothetical protein [Salinivirgaceae bacterium]
MLAKRFVGAKGKLRRAHSTAVIDVRLPGYPIVESVGGSGVECHFCRNHVPRQTYRSINFSLAALAHKRNVDSLRVIDAAS